MQRETSPPFVGRFDRSVDGKGRVIFPTRLRPVFDQKGYIAPHEDGCLALWTSEEFEKEADRQHVREVESRRTRDEVREWFSKVSKVALDLQGRMAIPGDLRSHAGLEDTALFVGVHDRFELWSTARWDHRFDDATDAGS
ncbi:MAG: division/cell wall cluster transcriptional repressor MraZ [Acidimicrobiales bacterium]